MPTEIIASLISSIVGGLLVAILNHLVARRKTTAEIEHLKAEADKSRAETEKLRTETSKLASEIEDLSTTVGEVDYQIAPLVSERIIYDGRSGIEGYDIVGEGKGSLSFVDGILHIHVETNYELQLCKYVYDGNIQEYIPKDEERTGNRKIRVSCETKSVKGSQRLVFFFRGISDDKPLSRRGITASQGEWRKADLYFRVPFHITCRMGLFLSNEFEGCDTLQLRNLVLAEHSE